MLTPIYLDNHRLTSPSPESCKAMLPYLTEKWTDPIAPYAAGVEVASDVRAAYEKIFSFFAAGKDGRFLVTSSGAEAVNHLFSSLFRDLSKVEGKNHFLTSTIEEAPTLMALGRLEEEGAFAQMLAPNSEGVVTAQAVEEAITAKTALVSLSWANGLTGVINPVEEIAEVCRQKKTLLHLEASYLLGKTFFDPEEPLPADILTFESSLLHAPRGTGGLYYANTVPMSPLILGGQEQWGMRGGPLDVAGIVALAKAAEQLDEGLNHMCTEVVRLRNAFEENLLDAVPAAQSLCMDADRLPNTSVIAFPFVSNEALLFALSRKGVFASVGGGKFQRLDRVLQLTGIDAGVAGSALHFSLSRYTTESDIQAAVDKIKEAYHQLSKMSEKIAFTKMGG
ncbi:aminotransferase class V-fold PLP-dependent enzyme [Simkania negevensis]|uniref:Aminotransferase class V-fold PLP-dependent enzyme n=1 Tax=Simkania negevensis TaxID=83561 RepID=A0ABS3APG5_9BACT|nr:aminotransferase class V-fold PLP-dependent enzyme [Simkania negevensis]